ncbi:MAG TPA: 2'-5' RNA ligase family protein [Mycobacteriales bacterium]
MTARRDIGVALGLPDPISAELQAWRERLGDPSARRIVPHVTLLPPTAVREERMPDVEEHLRGVAETMSPFVVRLRGSATFRPVSPVVFVPLAQGISECELLAAAVRKGPLARALRFPYHPHVTIAQDVPDEALDRGYAELAAFDACFRAWGFSLFEQGSDHVWRKQRDFPFGTSPLGPQERPPGW